MRRCTSITHFSVREIRYVKFRRHVVLVSSCFRSGRRLDAVRYAVRAVASLPEACVEEGFGYFTKGKR